MSNIAPKTKIQTIGFVRLLVLGASLSLFGAALSILLDADTHPKPSFLYPSISITVTCSFLVYYAGNAYAKRNYPLASLIWTVCLVLTTALPFLQLLPIEYDNEVLLHIKYLSPPIWLYSVSFPILLFLILEIRIKDSTQIPLSVFPIGLSVLSSIILMFFSSALIASIGNDSELIMLPMTLFLSSAIPILITCLIVSITVLTKKGYILVGTTSLILIGLAVEYFSTLLYGGPYFIESSSYIPYPGFPILPVLAGTIPGIVLVLAGIAIGREIFFNSIETLNEIVPTNVK